MKGISKAPNPDMMEDYTADTLKPARKRSRKGESNGPGTAPGRLCCLHLDCHQLSVSTHTSQHSAGVVLYTVNFVERVCFTVLALLMQPGPGAD